MVYYRVEGGTMWKPHMEMVHYCGGGRIGGPGYLMGVRHITDIFVTLDWIGLE